VADVQDHNLIFADRVEDQVGMPPNGQDPNAVALLKGATAARECSDQIDSFAYSEVDRL
jgi:hypothetical protein